MKDASRIIDEIRQIEKQYEGEVGSRRRPWPASIRSRIDQLSNLGMSFRAISEATGVPYYSIMNWRHGKHREKKESFHALTVAAPIEPVATVTVPVVSSDTEAWPSGTVTVTTPDGYQLACETGRLAVRLLNELRREERS